MIDTTSLPDPEAAARLVLLAAWCAMADRQAVLNPPHFLFGRDAEPLALDAAAMHLAALPKPLWIDSHAEDHWVRVRTAPVEPGTDSFDESFVYLPPVTGNPDQANILIIGGRTCLRIAPRTVTAAASEYRFRDPAGSASDFVGSAFVGSLGLSARDLEGIAQVIVLGRSSGSGSGWEMFVPPAGGWENPAV